MANGTYTREDRDEIRDLYMRYAEAIDEGRYQEWVALFTDDGVFESGRFGRHAGHKELERFTATYRDHLGGAQARHMISNVLFTVSGDSANGSCYLLYSHCKAGRVQQMTVATYADTLRKVDGRWLFQSRKVKLDGLV